MVLCGRAEESGRRADGRDHDGNEGVCVLCCVFGVLEKWNVQEGRKGGKVSGKCKKKAGGVFEVRVK